jgi:hypothetical protein
VSAEIGRRLAVATDELSRRVLVLALSLDPVPRPARSSSASRRAAPARRTCRRRSASGSGAEPGAGLALCAAALPAGAACVIDAHGEITNPFAPGCGDVIFTYTANDNAGTNIALGYPPPVPVASLTPVAGFREYDSLFARHQSLLA